MISFFYFGMQIHDFDRSIPTDIALQAKDKFAEIENEFIRRQEGIGDVRALEAVQKYIKHGERMWESS